MINIAVCDDDLIYASGIETLLVNISKSRKLDLNIEVYSDGSELWNAICNGEKFDIIYLDIEMKCVNGIDVAKQIRSGDYNVLLIYISSYENYFIELFEVEPFRFIKKPVDLKLFENYFMKAYERVSHNDAYFEYQFNKVQHRYLIKDILYFESSGRSIVLHGVNEEIRFYGKLSQIEKELTDGNVPFIRIHQSFLVNYRYITQISFYNLILTDGTSLQISESRQKNVRKQYNELMRKDYVYEGDVN